jgi:hypothetical protein
VNDELEGKWKGSVSPNLRFYTCIYLEGQRKTAKNFVRAGLQAET